MSLILWFGMIIGAVLLDQISKMIVVENLMPIGSAEFLPGFIGFRYTENTGAAFGMLQDHRWFFLIISSVAITAIIVLMIVYRKKINPLLGIALSFIAGGGIGNQIDRIMNGYVVDFIEFQFIDFAIFNVADIFVSVGACLGVLYVLVYEIFKKGDRSNLK